MLAFQHFQRDFGRHLRDPRDAPRPAGVPARRMAIYNELLYNNLEGFLLACFPVTRRVLGARRWPKLVRAFFREARCHTPYFREIPREFLEWLGALAAPPVPLPPWLKELAHYEWVELALDVMDVAPSAHDPQGDLMDGVPVLAPALMNLAYAWPVQRIGPDWRPRKAVPTHLLVYRDTADTVRFIELQAPTARLIALLQDGMSGSAACALLADELARPAGELSKHTAATLEHLRANDAILGTRS